MRKAAFSNWLTNGVTRLCGIRNPSQDMLAKAGLDIGKITEVDYSGQGSRKAEQSGDAISDSQAKRLWAIARGKGWTEVQVKVLLEGFTIAHTAEIPRSKYDTIIKVVEAPPAPEIIAEAKAREGGNGKKEGSA